MKSFNATRLSRASSRNINHSGESGFTLLETTIALLMMMIVGLGVGSLIFYSVRQNFGANDRVVALALAQQRMEIMRNSPFDSLVATPANGVSESNVSSAGRRFTVTTTITDENLVNAKPGIPERPERKIVSVQVRPQGTATQWAGGQVTLTSLRAAVSLGPNREPNQPAAP